MKNVEVEVRSFISKEQHEELLSFFRENSKLIKEDYQETYYFDSDQDLRIQKNNLFSKIWLKKGDMHDDYREEIEIVFDRDNFEKLEELFLTLGHSVNIKWFRNRHQFDWNGVKVCLDYTKGYGYVIELEMMGDEDNKEELLDDLKSKFEELGIGITPKKEFGQKFEHYKENWKELVNN
ncbi:MAG: CYTH domain-containing protein [Patescibacteria group bacterium]|nr:CYTH domain-containing protein [Patescibacteria group bacterium]